MPGIVEVPVVELLPPTPSGLSSLWSGPATNPSMEMDMWLVTKDMLSDRLGSSVLVCGP